MNMIELHSTIDKILQMLADNGKSEKTLKVYIQTGFGAFFRNYNKKGTTLISIQEIDRFIMEQRTNFEQGKYSKWKWGIIRRSGELIKYYAVTNTIDLDRLRPWVTKLRKPYQSITKDDPTEEQMKNPDDIFALAWKVRKELYALNYSEKTIMHYTSEGLSVILNAHYKQGLTNISEQLITELVADKRKCYENGTTSRVLYQDLRKAAYLIFELHSTGKIIPRKITNWDFKQLSPKYTQLLNEFCENAKRMGILSASTIKSSRSAVRKLLFELERRNCYSFDNITLPKINDVISYILSNYTGGLGWAIFCIRYFLRYLYESGNSSIDLSHTIPESIAGKKIYREGFNSDEISALLNSVDVSTAIGKRDYAIMMLASQTGLRACDVAALKYDNINWHTMEIRIIQCKTKKLVSLPLSSESGNAIANYIVEARPKSDLPYVFLCHNAPIRPIKNRSASAIISRYMKRIGIEDNVPRRGFHSFRRAFGTRLLQCETSLEVIQQILGHSNIDSMKPYLSIDEIGLKECSLNLSFLKKEEE